MIYLPPFDWVNHLEKSIMTLCRQFMLFFERRFFSRKPQHRDPEKRNVRKKWPLIVSALFWRRIKESERENPIVGQI